MTKEYIERDLLVFESLPAAASRFVKEYQPDAVAEALAVAAADWVKSEAEWRRMGAPGHSASPFCCGWVSPATVGSTGSCGSPM
jgi:hypothetical protein